MPEGTKNITLTTSERKEIRRVFGVVHSNLAGQMAGNTYTWDDQELRKDTIDLNRYKSIIDKMK